MDSVKSETEEEIDSEENELLGLDDGNSHGDGIADFDDIEETAEDLMTDMKLEDEIDEVRAVEPDFKWSYHIEIYPWTIEDMSDNFIKLVKLAQFSQTFMRKKGLIKGVDNEKIDDKLQDRQRKGCVHFYTDSWQNAKNIIRSSTWKTMTSKQLTYEITRRGPDVGQIESAYLEVDTYTACKCRFREKAKGEFKDRTAKVSNLPGTISREFLDVVFCRALAATGGGTSAQEYFKERDGKLQQRLSDIPGFDGSLNFDCITRGSCRSFVMAHKNVYIEGQRIDIVANTKETMIAPPPQESATKPKLTTTASSIVCTPSAAAVTSQFAEMKPQAQVQPNTSPFCAATFQQAQPLAGRGTWASRARGIVNMSSRGMLGVPSTGAGRMSAKDSNQIVARGRGMGRAMVVPQRPISAPMARGGVLIPMTGRQKMNEKMKRSSFGMVTTAGGVPMAGIASIPSGSMAGVRNPKMGSLGDSFKQEIASLQSQLERNTQELEAKIAMLQKTSESAAAFYDTDMNVYQESGWDESDFDYSGDFCVDVEDLDDSYFLTQGAIPGIHGYQSQNMGVQRPPRMAANMIVPGLPGNLGPGFPGMGLNQSMMGGAPPPPGNVMLGMPKHQGFMSMPHGMASNPHRGGRGMRRGGGGGRENKGAMW